jgi:hypothetical protein
MQTAPVPPPAQANPYLNTPVPPASWALVGSNQLGKQGFTVLLKIFESLK